MGIPPIKNNKYLKNCKFYQENTLKKDVSPFLGQMLVTEEKWCLSLQSSLPSQHSPNTQSY